ncbi:conjugal transfer protein [Salmonella enterica subsp. enterica]|uniref:Conjugal transfer protein n=1 Tax=Salmonella enteritidis TaxID=149539 RepID=A0A5V0BPN7_SALEN|nr:conjugal transfer protein [Salmonella enterica subsp. enterica]EBG0215174.1 conjugal transfer protein [Salmonella enterica subsp. enterica serovar Louisiana]EBR5150637.1 conjugal transfer protein [Salmonella enterica]EBS5458874.1 conjugal transfer protein [Salmonella enterica subsp. enterica serovar Enteritidis]ECR4402977.1 conjugal transfer protein [Salmonella enterica subsp. enterica serovar Ona]ECY7870689.1 conjugal transfer protein [Salmonella enterica subsp. enterica serovar Wilhelmsbu
MRMTQPRAWCLLGFLLVSGVQAAESDELALVMKQLDQVQAALERARVVAVQDGQNGRFYFDYLRATQDIKAIRQGIGIYLEPSRAQPMPSASLSGQYRLERRP